MKKTQAISFDPRGFIRIGNRTPEALARQLAIQKLYAKLKVNDGGCLEFQGFRHPDGYGQISYRNEAYRAHKLMYILMHGPVPDGMVVMHTCDNPPCCNPDHLELGTKADNNRDMAKKGRGKYQKATSCKNGHKFTLENTRITAQGFRACKTCARVRLRMKAGWTREQAESLPPTSPGCRPVGASFKNPPAIEKPTRELSMVGSSPRMRAYRERKRALRQQTESQ